MHLRLILVILFSLFVTAYSGTCSGTWDTSNDCNDSQATVSTTADGTTDAQCCVCNSGYVTSVANDFASCAKICDSNANCDAATKYVDTSQTCATGTCAGTDTNCCADKATCDSNANCDAATKYVDTTKKCATGTCAGTDTNCCADKQQCSAWDASNDCNAGRSVTDGNKYCADDSCEETECCENDAVVTTAAPTTAAPTTAAPDTEFELGNLVLYMTISLVSALFLSVALYFFTSNRLESGSSVEMVPLVTGFANRRKRVDF